jgi:hypothetical protein
MSANKIIFGGFNMRIAHFPSDSIGDIIKAQTIGMWQFGPHRNLQAVQPGDIIMMSLNESVRFFIIGFANSKVADLHTNVEWPGAIDMDNDRKNVYEITINPLKHMRELTKEEVESIVEVNLNNQGCYYKKEIHDISKLV